MTIQVFARKDDGTEVNVTEGVQALYDHCVGSMDWGSGFLSIEEAAGIIKIAQHCGYLVPETAEETFANYARYYGGCGALICVVCGEEVKYRYAARLKDGTVAKAGWSHSAGEPDHEPRLWATDTP